MFLAVHIADGALNWPVLVSGFVIAGLLLARSLVRLHPEEIPRIALLAAALFVSSSLQVPIGLAFRVHPVLAGIVGVLLGRRAMLAVVAGLLLQLALLGHGGITTLGINAVVLGVPATLAGWAYPRMSGAGNVAAWWWLVIAVGVWIVSADLAVLWTRTSLSSDLLERFFSSANGMAMGLAQFVAMASLWRWRPQPAFAAGLLLGVGGVLSAVMLDAMLLRYGGVPGLEPAAGLFWLLHLPLAAIEGLVAGGVLVFVERVRPEWLIRPLDLGA